MNNNKLCCSENHEFLLNGFWWLIKRIAESGGHGGGRGVRHRVNLVSTNMYNNVAIAVR